MLTPSHHLPRHDGVGPSRQLTIHTRISGKVIIVIFLLAWMQRPSMILPPASWYSYSHQRGPCLGSALPLIWAAYHLSLAFHPYHRWPGNSLPLASLFSSAEPFLPSPTLFVSLESDSFILFGKLVCNVESNRWGSSIFAFCLSSFINASICLDVSACESMMFLFLRQNFSNFEFCLCLIDGFVAQTLDNE